MVLYDVYNNTTHKQPFSFVLHVCLRLEFTSNCQCADCSNCFAWSLAHPAANTNWLIITCSFNESILRICRLKILEHEPHTSLHQVCFQTTHPPSDVNDVITLSVIGWKSGGCYINLLSPLYTLLLLFYESITLPLGI